MRALAGAIASLFIFQAFAALAVAGATAGNALEAPTQPVASAPTAAPAVLPQEKIGGAVQGGAIVEGATPDMTAQEVFALAHHRSPTLKLPAPISREEIDASAKSYQPQTITPLVDTDMNDPDRARWFNRTDTEFLGESVNGAAQGPGRVDVDWWQFYLGFTPASADTISFDISKAAGEDFWARVYTFPEFYQDPGQVSRYSFYAYLNKTQDASEPTRITITAYESTTYLMWLLTPRRNGCCTVDYAITNISFTTVTPADDNNNETRAEAYTAASPPTDREVEQNSDLYDVFDLSALVPLDISRGDYATVNLTASFGDGRVGSSDWWNGSADGPNDGSVISVGSLELIYRDVRGFWRMYSSSNFANNSTFIAGLVNGTPIYAGVSVTAYAWDSGGIRDYSTVPGWLRYSITGFSAYVDQAPRPAGLIPPKSMYEDDVPSGTNLYDLSPYFTDDHDGGSLWFSVVYVAFSSIRATISGNYLSVSSTQPNYWGNVTIQIAGHDLGLDGVARNADDHSANSNYFTVTIQAVNDPPVVSAYGGLLFTGSELSFTLAQDTALTLEAIADDPDIPPAFAFTISQSLAFVTFYATNGTLILAPTNADVGVYQLSVSALDEAGGMSTVPIRISVTNVNDEPRFIRVGGFDVGAFPTFNAVQGQNFTLTLQVSDPDYLVGIQDGLNYTADKNFFGMLRDPSDQRNVTAYFTPTNAQVGTMTVRFSVTDGALGQFDDNVSVTLVVLNTNDRPVIVSASTLLTFTIGPSRELHFNATDGATQNQEFRFVLRATDPDVEGGVGDTLTFSTSWPGKFHTVAGTDGLTADVFFTPDQADARAGRVMVTLYVNDSGAPSYSDAITVFIDVANVNDPPVLVAVFALNLTEDVPFSYAFEATDPDGDPVTFGSDSARLLVDSSTGTVELTPTNDLIEGKDLAFDVTVTARDNHAGVTAMVVHILIKNVNDAPSRVKILAPADSSGFAAGESITFTGDAEDIDSDDRAALTYKWYADDQEIGEGKLLNHPLDNPASEPKTVTVRLEVRDPHGATASTNVSIVVAGTPKPSPGFELPAVIAGLSAAAAVGVLAARRNRRS